MNQVKINLGGEVSSNTFTLYTTAGIGDFGPCVFAARNGEPIHGEALSQPIAERFAAREDVVFVHDTTRIWAMRR